MHQQGSVDQDQAAAWKGWLLVVFSFMSCVCVGQPSSIYSNDYIPFKYSLIFGDLPQMAHDGSPLTKRFAMPLADYGDLQYYRAHYSNAAGGYYNVLASLSSQAGGPDPEKDKSGLAGLSTRALIRTIQVAGLDDKSFKAFTSVANTAGMLYHTRGKFSKAEEVFQRVLEMRGSRFGKTGREFVNSLHNMAVLKKDLGQYEEAENMFNYLVPTLRKLFGANSMQYAVVLNNKAMLLAELGRTKEAVALLDESLHVGKSVFTPEYLSLIHI